MDKLYELKEMLCRELEKYAGKEMTASNLEYIDKLAHAIKNLDKIIEAKEENSYAMGRSYRRGMSNRGSYGDEDMSHNRDSRGRYSRENSRHGDMVEELRDLMEDAPENTKHEFRKFISKIESM